jgi:hypothetical protein
MGPRWQWRYSRALDNTRNLEHNKNMHLSVNQFRLRRRLGQAETVTRKLMNAFGRMAPSDHHHPTLAALVAGARPALRLIGAVAGLQRVENAGAVALARAWAQARKSRK